MLRLGSSNVAGFPLPYELQQTQLYADGVVDEGDGIDTSDIPQTLALAAAHTLSVHDLLCQLSLRPKRADRLDLAGNLLVAAAALGSEILCSKALAHGAQWNSKPDFFGDAFASAARNGRSDVLSLLMREARLRSQDLVMDAGFYLANALVHASTSGHADFATKVLDQNVLDARHLGFYDLGITCAVQNAHDELVCELINHRLSITLADRKAFGGKVIGYAARNRRQVVVRRILRDASALLYKFDIRRALEDACRVGSATIVDLILSHSIPESLNIAAYWAARSGHGPCLERVLQASEPMSLPVIVDALAGACFSSSRTFEQVLKALPSSTGVDLAFDASRYVPLLETLANSGVFDEMDLTLHFQSVHNDEATDCYPYGTLVMKCATSSLP